MWLEFGFVPVHLPNLLFLPFVSIPFMYLPYMCILCVFVQDKSTLLILCENGFAVQVPAPVPGKQDAVTTYHIKNLPTQYFHFYSIKSRIKVKTSSVAEFHLHCARWSSYPKEFLLPLFPHRVFAKLLESKYKVEAICGLKLQIIFGLFKPITQWKCGVNLDYN